MLFCRTRRNKYFTNQNSLLAVVIVFLLASPFGKKFYSPCVPLVQGSGAGDMLQHHEKSQFQSAENVGSFSTSKGNNGAYYEISKLHFASQSSTDVLELEYFNISVALEWSLRQRNDDVRLSSVLLQQRLRRKNNKQSSGDPKSQSQEEEKFNQEECDGGHSIGGGGCKFGSSVRSENLPPSSFQKKSQITAIEKQNRESLLLENTQTADEEGRHLQGTVKICIRVKPFETIVDRDGIEIGCLLHCPPHLQGQVCQSISAPSVVVSQNRRSTLSTDQLHQETNVEHDNIDLHNGDRSIPRTQTMQIAFDFLSFSPSLTSQSVALQSFISYYSDALHEENILLQNEGGKDLHFRVSTRSSSLRRHQRVLLPTDATTLSGVVQPLRSQLFGLRIPTAPRWSSGGYVPVVRVKLTNTMMDDSSALLSEQQDVDWGENQPPPPPPSAGAASCQLFIYDTPHVIDPPSTQDITIWESDISLQKTKLYQNFSLFSSYSVAMIKNEEAEEEESGREFSYSSQRQRKTRHHQQLPDFLDYTIVVFGSDPSAAAAGSTTSNSGRWLPFELQALVSFVDEDSLLAQEGLLKRQRKEGVTEYNSHGEVVTGLVQNMIEGSPAVIGGDRREAAPGGLKAAWEALVAFCYGLWSVLVVILEILSIFF